MENSALKKLQMELGDLERFEQLFKLCQTLFEYADKCHVDVQFSNATLGWEEFGISNLRGFAPQNRLVLINSDYLQKIKELPADTAWTQFFFLIHDLLHIYFYDQVTAHLDSSVWQKKDSFIACHLASEAFAVLGLDYWTFPKSDLESLGLTQPFGVAAQVDAAWIQKESHLAEKLLGLYREARPLSFEGISPKSSGKLRDLLGHETRYSEKQRIYTENFWNYFSGAEIQENPKPKLYKVQDWEPSFLTDSFQDLLGGNFKKPVAETYFCSKKPKPGERPDFRFQNAFSFEPKAVAKILRDDFGQNPSFHFLAAQLICVAEPESQLNKKILPLVPKLYKNVGKKDLRKEAQTLVAHLLETLGARFDLAQYKERDVFYLS